MARGDIRTTDTYLEKTSKLIPGEALAFFIAVSSMTWATSLDDPTKRNFVAVLAAAVGLIVIPFVLYKFQNVRSKAHYVVSVIAFLLWVFNVQYDRLPFYPDDDAPYILAGSLAVAFFTFLAPAFVPAKEAG
jgi:hypothetical protein